MNLGSWLIIQDFMAGNEGAGSPLFSGSPIYAYCTDVKFSVKNNNSGKPPIMADLTMTNDTNLYAHWYRRKGYTQYVSTEHPQIVTNGTWITELGSTNTLRKVLTPYKLFRMSISGHQFHIRGARLLDNLINGENETVGSIYKVGSGIPVIIDSINLDAASKTENDVNWSITFTEDK